MIFEINEFGILTILKRKGVFESLRRTVTCTRELISIYMCYSYLIGGRT